jgi:2,4-dienoyl-CoA reductase-like NADH-dependent reductase (Old Yellow Enzyme family)
VLAQVHISERLRLEHGVPTVLVDDAGDRDHAAQLVLSGRADLVAAPASVLDDRTDQPDQRATEPLRR